MINKKLTLTKSGVGIIEALVAVTVFTLGLVGVSKLIAVSLRSAQNSEMQGRVALLVTDAMERIRILGASTGNIAKKSFLDNANCNSLLGADLEKCNLGKQSRNEWNQQLSNIVTGTASICRKSTPTASSCSANNSTDTIFIEIQWSEKIVGKANASNAASISRSYKASVDF